MVFDDASDAVAVDSRRPDAFNDCIFSLLPFAPFATSGRLSDDEHTDDEMTSKKSWRRQRLTI